MCDNKKIPVAEAEAIRNRSLRMSHEQLRKEYVWNKQKKYTPCGEVILNTITVIIAITEVLSNPFIIPRSWYTCS